MSVSLSVKGRADRLLLPAARIGRAGRLLCRPFSSAPHEDALVIRWYYLWGAKRIPYTAIRSVRRVDMKHLRGKGRIWGTANLGYWASLDPGRPGKDAALILDLGNAVSPYITPDNVQAVEDIIRQRAGLGQVPHTGAGPFI
jgi:hypothetical protein